MLGINSQVKRGTRNPAMISAVKNRSTRWPLSIILRDQIRFNYPVLIPRRATSRELPGTNYTAITLFRAAGTPTNERALAPRMRNRNFKQPLRDRTKISSSEPRPTENDAELEEKGTPRRQRQVLFSTSWRLRISNIHRGTVPVTRAA